MGMLSYPEKIYFALARKYVKKVLQRGDVLGVLLFGSVVKNAVSTPNDIDIAVIYDGREILSNTIKASPVKIDALYYPREVIQEILYERNIRNRKDTWFKTTLWLNVLRNSLILYDPYCILSQWKKKASDWKWTSYEIQLAYKNSFESLKESINLYAREKYFESLLAVRDSNYNYIIFRLMKRQMIPSPRPKDLYRLVRRYEQSIRDSFDRVHGLDDREMKSNLASLISLFTEVWDTYDIPKKRGAYSEYINSLESYQKNELDITILNLRYSAFLLLREMLAKERYVTIVPYDTYQHLRLYEKSKSFKEVHELYQLLHYSEDEVDKEYIRENIKIMKKLLLH